MTSNADEARIRNVRSSRQSKVFITKHASALLAKIDISAIKTDVAVILDDKCKLVEQCLHWCSHLMIIFGCIVIGRADLIIAGDDVAVGRPNSCDCIVVDRSDGYACIIVGPFAVCAARIVDSEGCARDSAPSGPTGSLLCPGHEQQKAAIKGSKQKSKT